MPGRFESFEELYNDLLTGHEYEFYYNDKEYSIDSHCEISEEKRTYYVCFPDNAVSEFNSVDELLDGFIVDGKSFREFVFDVDVRIEF